MRRVPLGFVAQPKGLVGGPFGSSLVSSDYTESGVPVIRGGNMTSGRYIGGDFAFVSADKYERDLARNSASVGDLIYTQRGTLGQVAIVPVAGAPTYVISQSQMRLRVDEGIADPRFVYYASTSPEFLRQIDDRAISTGVPHINLGILAQLHIPLPPPTEQQAIAEVLGALDDKMAANTALAETTAAMARTEFAQIAPERADGPAFADVARVSGGGTPSTKLSELWNGDIMWATPTDLTSLPGPYLSNTSRTITAAGLDACSSALFEPGAILMTSRATIGAMAVATVPTAVNQGFIVVEPNDPWMKWWLFHDMQSRVEEFVSWANGATFLELSRGVFKQLRTRTAPEVEMRSFVTRADALHAVAMSILKENRTLAETRDVLLPQLMSGKLRVRDAERLASEAGA